MPKKLSLSLQLFQEYWPFLLPILILSLGLSSFPYPGSGARYSDFAVTHYPNAFFLQQALYKFHQIPLWSPAILSGFPFIAHPYSGIWYPPYWLALLFPLPLGLNLIVMLHLIWAGVGTYKFLRQHGLGRHSAIFGGLAFEAAPTLFAHLGAGHLMLLLAVCGTPWLLWAAGRNPGAGRIERLIQPGVVFALILVADPRWAIYAGCLWLAWELTQGERPRPIHRIGVQMLLAIALALPALWLYMEYAGLSTRAGLTPSEVLTFSLPPQALLGLLIPQPSQFYEWVLYPGILVLALTIVAAPWRKNRFQGRFWLLVLFLAFLFSLGANIAGMNLIVALPGFSQLRVPSRGLLLAAFAFSLLAAQGLERLLDSEAPFKRLRLIIFALITLSLSLDLILVWGGDRQSGFKALGPIGSLLIFAILVELHVRRKGRWFPLALIAVMLLDLFIIDNSLVNFRPSEEVLSESRRVAVDLSNQPGNFRVYSPSFSIPQQVAADFGLELADGVDPLQLSDYANFMQRASGVPAVGYSVTLPPLGDSSDPAAANAAYSPDLSLLGLLNVEYVVSQFPIQIDDLDEKGQTNGVFIYRNEKALPRAWVEDEAGAQRPVRDIVWNYNRILIHATGPGLVVLSEITYPGWKVRVDGQASEIQVYAHLLRAVDVPSGDHEVNFTFMPPGLVFGLPISILTLVSLFLFPRSTVRKR